MTAPTRYECRVTHVRAEPIRNAFTYPMHLWLADLDDLPRGRPRGRPLGGACFVARDHLGDPSLSIRANVDHFLASRGVSLGGGQVLMLTQPRALGYVFNPLTVYWCHGADGALAAVIAEVCNTHRERHCYLLRTDERGQARVAKGFYVSPFYPVDGSYLMSLPEPSDRLNLAVTLHRAGQRPFVATVRGHAVPGRRGRPWSTAAVMARIRRQGIGLYLRGLPVLPWPAPDSRPDAREGPS